MNWIKKSYEQFVLAVAAVLLLAAAGWIIMQARGLEVAIPTATAKSNKLPALDTSVIDQAAQHLAQPAKWTDGNQGSLFVSQQYILGPGNTLMSLNPDEADKTPPLHPPVPNSWIIKNKLSIVSTSVLTDDTDDDGFSNLVEWVGKVPSQPGTQSTNPQDKESHPPYVVQLRLKRFLKSQFRLIFQAWDGDPAKPETLTFQINTLDVRQPTQFVEMNKVIPGTKFKVVSFQKKQFTDPNGVEKDVSELTVENQETMSRIVLVMGQTADSPDSFALFEYLWGHATRKELRVKKDQTFSLEPEPDRQFKLIDIQESGAVIEDLKSGEKITVPPSEPAGRQ